MGRAIPLLPLWAVRPVQSLSACTRVHFTFFTMQTHNAFSVRYATIIGIISTQSSSCQNWAMALAIGRRTLTKGARVRSQANQCEICGRQNGTGTGFSPSATVLSCQYHYTNGPYSSSSTWRTLGNVQKNRELRSENQFLISPLRKRWKCLQCQMHKFKLPANTVILRQ